MKRFEHPAGQAFLIATLALGIAVNSQLSALLGEYVLNGDVPQHIYWMQGFNHKELFRNDLLTQYAIYMQPWGFVGFYRILSYFADPFTISKILPIALFTISAVYVFFFVKRVRNEYAACLAATAFMIIPVFIESMVGGHARSFGYPLTISFLFYLTKKSYKACSVILVLQALFYPMVFFICLLTYCFSLGHVWRSSFFLRTERSQLMSFVLALVIGGGILFAKHILITDSAIGTTLTKNQMIAHPEYYAEGRYPVLPTNPVVVETEKITIKPLLDIALHYPAELLNVRLLSLSTKILLFLAVVYVLWKAITGKLFIPKEIFYLIVAGLLMHKIADMFLLKLFLPERYLQYSIPLGFLIFCSIGFDDLLTQLGKGKIIRAVKILLLVVIVGHFNVIKGIGLQDESKNERLYAYLRSLPPDAVIAAHPYLADYIPAFTGRKVFVNFELSHPWYSKYWETIRIRTFDFFTAYYAEQPEDLYRFFRQYKIDYLVVDRRHFTTEYFTNQRIYFEPFNTFIMTHVELNSPKAVIEMSKHPRVVFVDDNIYVINAELFGVTSERRL